ncbi:MAG: hypothetical protein ISP90_03185 [Nevskia sp.]|nr:hypothetical protein [Nevskia sp.]
MKFFPRKWLRALYRDVAAAIHAAPGRTAPADREVRQPTKQTPEELWGLSQRFGSRGGRIETGGFKAESDEYHSR